MDCHPICNRASNEEAVVCRYLWRVLSFGVYNVCVARKIQSSFSIPGEPIGKPRMTQQDRWKKRPATDRYWEWCDIARVAAGLGKMEKANAEDYFGVIVFAHCSIPKSYSPKKRAALEGMLCSSKPDTDNIIKALCDALFENDERICIMQGYKYWAYDNEAPRLDVFLLPRERLEPKEG